MKWSYSLRIDFGWVAIILSMVLIYFGFIHIFESFTLEGSNREKIKDFFMGLTCTILGVSWLIGGMFR